MNRPFYSVKNIFKVLLLTLITLGLFGCDNKEVVDIGKDLIINESGDYLLEEDKYSKVSNVVVNIEDVTLENKDLKEVTINSTVNDGNVYLKNINGDNLYVYGGGINSIHLINSNFDNVYVKRVDDKVRITSEGNGKINTLTILEGSNDVKLDGSIDEIIVNAEDIDIEANVKSNKIDLNNNEISIVLKKNSAVKELYLNGNENDCFISSNVNLINFKEETTNSFALITDEGKVDTLNVNGEHSTIRIEGEVNDFILNSSFSEISVDGSVNNLDIKENGVGSRIILPEKENIKTLKVDSDLGSINLDHNNDFVIGKIVYTQQYVQVEQPQIVTHTTQVTTMAYVYWRNFDGTLLEKDLVKLGEMPHYDGETPTKEKDAQYTYTFDSWDHEIVPVTDAVTYKAVYKNEVNKYTVNFECNDVTLGSLSETKLENVPYGSKLIVDENKIYYDNSLVCEATPNSIVEGNQEITLEGFDNVPEQIEEDTTITAKFVRSTKKYNVTFHYNSIDAVDETIEVVHGERASEPNVVYVGHVLDGFYTDNNVWSNKWDFDTYITQDVELYAKWSVARFKVSFIVPSGNGTPQVSELLDVPYNTRFEFNPNHGATAMDLDCVDPQYNEIVSIDVTPDTDSTQYVFSAYEPESGYITEDTTISAIILSTARTYNVNFVSYNGILNELTKNIKYGNKVEKPTVTITRDGYEFEDWYKENTFTNKWDFNNDVVTGQTNLYAKFLPKQYSITYNYNEGKLAEGVTNPTTYNIESESFTINNPSKVGYDFVGWTINNTTTDSNLIIEKGTMGDLVLSAKYTPRNDTKYTIKHYKEALDGTYPNELCEVENLTGTTNSVINPTVKTYEGFTSPDVIKDVIAADGSTIVSYYYAREIYNVLVSGDIYGDISYNGSIYKQVTIDSVKYGTPIELNDINIIIGTHVFTPQENATTAQYSYQFTKWENISATVTGDTTICAIFSSSPIQYNITYNLNGGVLAADNPTVFDANTNTFTLNNPIKVGYTFTGWTGTGLSSLTTTVTITKGSTGSRSYTANFTPNTNTTYTVRHFKQLLDGSYPLIANDTDNLTGTTATTVTPDTKSYEGFTAPQTQTVTILPDGSLAIDYKYTRNSYNVLFNTDGGSKINSQTVLYENKATTPQVPIKNGYAFAGWYKDSEFKNEFDFDNEKITKETTIYVKWNILKFEVTIKSSNTVYGDVDFTKLTDISYGTNYSTEGNKLTIGSTVITATPKSKNVSESYNFNSWSTTFGTITQNTTIIALFDATVNPYDVVFDLQGHGKAVASIVVEYGNKVSRPTDPSEVGYQFINWYKEKECTNVWNFDSDTIVEDTTLYALWTPNTNTAYTVKHYKQLLDGTYSLSADDTDNLTGTTATTVTPDTKSYEGFTAPEKSELTILADGTAVKEYKYTRNSYTLTWSSDGDTLTGDYTKGSIKYGTTIISPNTPTKTGYTFTAWTPTVAQTMPAANTTYTATWTPNTNTAYTVKHYKQLLDGTYSQTADDTDNLTGTTAASVTPDTKSYEGFTAPEKSELTILADGTAVKEYKYTRNSYTVTFNTNEGSSIDSQTVKYEAKASKPTSNPTKTGYTFAGWYTTNSLDTEFNFATTEIKDNTTIYAKWTPTSYSISYTLNDGTATNPTTYTIETDTFTLTNPTKTGYTFAGWTGTGLSSPTTTVTITKGSTGDKSYTATWTINNYTVSFNIGSHALEGETTPQSQTIVYGNKVTVVPDVKPATDLQYIFRGWYTKDGTDNDWGTKWDFDNNTVSSDTVLYAKITQAIYSILGDSISTLETFITSGNRPRYYPSALEGKSHQGTLKIEYEDTWWGKIIIDEKAVLGVNESWAGSRVVCTNTKNTGDEGPDRCISSMTRLQHLDDNGTPDRIYVYGGTNDVGHSVTLGTFNKNLELNLTSNLITNFADAYTQMILRLQYYYPDTEIILLTPTYTSSYYNTTSLTKYNNLIKEIAEHFELPVIDLTLSGIQTSDLFDGIHPNVNGMNYIAKYVECSLVGKCPLLTLEQNNGKGITDGETINVEIIGQEYGELSCVSSNPKVAKCQISDTTLKIIPQNKEGNATITVIGNDLITRYLYTNEDVELGLSSNVIKVNKSATKEIAIIGKNYGTLSCETSDNSIVACSIEHKEALITRTSNNSRVQELPSNITKDTNLFNALSLYNGYYGESAWTENYYSVVIPVVPGDKVSASSFAAASNNGNGGSTNGIRVTYMYDDTYKVSCSPQNVFDEYSDYGYLTVPENVNTMSIAFWTNDDSNFAYLLTADDEIESDVLIIEGLDDGRATITLNEDSIKNRKAIADIACGNVGIQISPKNGDLFNDGDTSEIRILESNISSLNCVSANEDIASCKINSLLPIEYDELDYVKADGNQYLSIDVKPVFNNTKIIAKFMPESIVTGDNRNYLFGYRRTEGVGNGIGFGVTGSQFLSDYFGNRSFENGAKANSIYTVIKDNEVTSIYDENEILVSQITNTNFASETIEDLGIFAIHMEAQTGNKYIVGGNKGFIGRLYYLEVLDSNNNTLAKLVPAKNSENVAGLYDLSSKKFYSSISGTPLIAGNSTNTGKDIIVTSGNTIGTTELTIIETVDNYSSKYIVNVYDKNDPTLHVINFETNGGNLISKDIVSDSEFPYIVDIIPQKDGYTFDGWYDNEQFNGSKITRLETTGSYNLYAKWIENTYTINFHTNGGNKIDSINLKTSQFPYEITDVSIMKDYTFVGWYDNKELNGNSITSIKEPDNYDLYAKWKLTENSYNNLDSSIIWFNESSISPSYNYKDVPNVNGYGWTYQNQSEWVGEPVNVFQFKTSYKNGGYFEYGIVNEYKDSTIDNSRYYCVDFSSEAVNSNGVATIVLPEPIILNEGEFIVFYPFTLPESTPFYYNSNNSSGLGKFYSDVPISNRNSGSWHANASQLGIAIGYLDSASDGEYSLTYHYELGDRVLHLYDDNYPYTINFKPSRAGYSFMGWYDNESYEGDPITIIEEASNKTLYAKWQLNTYYITFESNGGTEFETLTVKGNQFPVTINQLPIKDNSIFKGWYLNSSYSGNRVTELTDPQDYTLYARWSSGDEIQNLDDRVTWYNKNYISNNFNYSDSVNVAGHGWAYSNQTPFYGKEINTIQFKTGLTNGGVFEIGVATKSDTHSIDEIDETRTYTVNFTSNDINEDNVVTIVLDKSITIKEGEYLVVYPKTQPANGAFMYGSSTSNTLGGFYTDIPISRRNSNSWNGPNSSSELGFAFGYYVPDDSELITILFNSNGGSTVEPLYIKGSQFPYAIPTNIIPTKTNYAFDGWYDNQACEGNEIKVLTEVKNYELFAKWTDVVTLTYNGNSNTSGTVPSADLLSPGRETEVSNALDLVKNGKQFICWNTKADGTGISYYPGDKITINEATTLYAKYDKTVSILGDSISTLKGYIPDTNRTRYYVNDEDFDNGLIKIAYNETYWGKLIEDNNLLFGFNESWAGSVVANFGNNPNQDISEDKAMSNMPRISKLDDNGTPDVILFFGGTNDILQASSSNLPVGKFNKELVYDESTKTFESFANAYQMAIMRLQHTYPHAQIVCITPGKTSSYSETLLSSYVSVIKDIANEYSLSCLDLSTIIKDNTYLVDGVHPNASGMILIEYNLAKLLGYNAINPDERNLYKSYEILDEYYNGSAWGKNNNVVSIVIDVKPGDKVRANSFGESNGIRVTYLQPDGRTSIKSLSPQDVYNEYYKDEHKYLVVPDGVTKMNVPFWSKSDSNYCYILTEEEATEQYNAYNLAKENNYLLSGYWNEPTSGKWNFDKGNTSAIYSIIVKVNPCDRITSNSINSTSSIRVSFMGENHSLENPDIIQSYSPTQVLKLLDSLGYISVPENTEWACVSYMSDDAKNYLNILGYKESDFIFKDYINRENPLLISNNSINTISEVNLVNDSNLEKGYFKENAQFDANTNYYSYTFDVNPGDRIVFDGYKYRATYFTSYTDKENNVYINFAPTDVEKEYLKYGFITVPANVLKMSVTFDDNLSNHYLYKLQNNLYQKANSESLIFNKYTLGDGSFASHDSGAVVSTFIKVRKGQKIIANSLLTKDLNGSGVNDSIRITFLSNNAIFNSDETMINDPGYISVDGNTVKTSISTKGYYEVPKDGYLSIPWWTASDNNYIYIY